MLTTNQKGAIAETAIAHAAVKLGIGVFKPLADERCDFVFDLRPQLVRVQCKWAVRTGDAVSIRCYSSCRTSTGTVRLVYTREEIDALAAYCAELDRCYLLPMAMFAGQKQIQLRLAPARNNQRTGINWAREFEFAATLRRLGAVAQLGEH